MGSANCYTCLKCGSTYAESSSCHNEPEEHQWEVYYHGGKEPIKDEYCNRCGTYKSHLEKRIANNKSVI